MQAIKYIQNAKTIEGFKKTATIAFNKCNTLQEWREVVEACYQKHDWFVYGSRQIRYDLGRSHYGDTLDEINKISRRWYERYCESKGLDPIKESGGMYGFVSY